MRKFNTDGFLGEEIEEWVKKYHQDNDVLFQYCDELNRFAHKTLSQLVIHNKDGQEILVQQKVIRTRCKN